MQGFPAAARHGDAGTPTETAQGGEVRLPASELPIAAMKVLASAARMADNLHRELHKHSNREPDDENSQ